MELGLVEKVEHTVCRIRIPPQEVCRLGGFGYSGRMTSHIEDPGLATGLRCFNNAVPERVIYKVAWSQRLTNQAADDLEKGEVCGVADKHELAPSIRDQAGETHRGRQGAATAAADATTRYVDRQFRRRQPGWRRVDERALMADAALNTTLARLMTIASLLAPLAGMASPSTAATLAGFYPARRHSRNGNVCRIFLAER